MEIFLGIVAVLIAMVIFQINALNSYNKRFQQIVELSAKHNKKTNGQEFNIKPIRFYDELNRPRCADSNYEERSNNKIIISRYSVNDVEYKAYKVEIENINGIALIYAVPLESI